MAQGPALDVYKMEATPLTDREMAVRDYFVSEYQKDNDPYKACIRMGFLATYATDQCKVFMNDGYVLRKIAYLNAQANLPSDADKAEMLANLRWLSHNGSTSSRTTATKLYMEAQGYIAKNEDGEEARASALIEALKSFAENAPQ